MKKKLLTGILAGILAVGALTGCGNNSDGATAVLKNPADTQTSDNPDGATTDSGAAADQDSDGGAAADSDAADGGSAAEGGTITVAASPTPHAEILEQAKPLLADQGWDLQVTVFDDYIMPNDVVESGEFDANYFQHIPYLEQFNTDKGTHLVNAGGVHYEPFGIYPGTKSDLSALEAGDVIAIPNDTTNEARALLLLQDNGIITLKDGGGQPGSVL